MSSSGDAPGGRRDRGEESSSSSSSTSRCPSGLRVLSLANCGVAHRGTSSLANALKKGPCRDLRLLDLSNNNLSTASLMDFRHVPGLRVRYTKESLVERRNYKDIIIQILCMLLGFCLYALTHVHRRSLHGAMGAHGLPSHAIEAISNIINEDIYYDGRSLEASPPYLHKWPPEYMPGQGERVSPHHLLSICRGLATSLSPTLPPNAPPHLLYQWPDFIADCHNEEPWNDSTLSYLIPPIDDPAIMSDFHHGLGRLRVRGQGITDQGAHYIAGGIKSGLLRSLWDLDLMVNNISPAGVADILHALSGEGSMSVPLPCLEGLGVDYNGVGLPNVAPALTKAIEGMRQRKCRGLALLSFNEDLALPAANSMLSSHYYYHHHALHSLFESFRHGSCRSLKVLRLAGNGLGDDMVMQLLGSMVEGRCQKLEEVDFSRNNLTTTTATVLARHLKAGAFPHLRRLYMRHNTILCQGAVALAQATLDSRRWTTLQHLDISYNGITPDSACAAQASALHDADHSPTAIKVLELEGNLLDDSILYYLAKAVMPGKPLESLERLNLRRCGLVDGDIQIFLQAVGLRPTLSSDRIGDDNGCEASARAIADSQPSSSTWEYQAKERRRCRRLCLSDDYNVDAVPRPPSYSRQPSVGPARLKVLDLAYNLHTTRAVEEAALAFGCSCSGSFRTIDLRTEQYKGSSTSTSASASFAIYSASRVMQSFLLSNYDCPNDCQGRVQVVVDRALAKLLASTA